MPELVTFLPVGANHKTRPHLCRDLAGAPAPDLPRRSSPESSRANHPKPICAAHKRLSGVHSTVNCD